jgi:hypothetical protein
MPEAEGALEHVPGLVVSVVDVERSDPVRPDFRRPLDDHEVVFGRAQRSSGEPLEHPKRLEAVDRRTCVRVEHTFP